MSRRETLSEIGQRLARAGMTVHARAKAPGDQVAPHRMRPAHVVALLKRYPALYAEGWREPSLRASLFAQEGFACGDGWFGIVERLSAELAADPGLRVLSLGDDTGRLTVKIGGRDSPGMRAAIATAEEESARTCELCGRPGVQARGALCGARCVPCSAKPVSVNAAEARAALAMLRRQIAGRRRTRRVRFA